MAWSFKKRLFDVPTFWTILDTAGRSVGSIVRAQRVLGPAFVERIQLAVTEVNGCIYCSWLHSRNALRAGVSQKELEGYLVGDLAEAPPEEATALMFAQHYAESTGRVDEEAWRRLVQAYGPTRADAVLASIRAIMMGNAHGVMFEALTLRLRGRPVQGSTLWDELGVVLGAALLPVCLVRGLLRGPPPLRLA